MYGRTAAIALAILGTAAAAQTMRSPANFQKVSEVPGGWAWYLNKTSVRSNGSDRRFWLSGDYRGGGRVRQSMMEVKLSCSTGLHIPLHTTTHDAAGRILSETFRGDSSSNWTRPSATSPVTAARAWVCR